MIVVHVEIWPFGDRTNKRTLGTMAIANDATGDKERGNYYAALGHSGVFVNKPGAWKTGTVTGHLRSLSPYHLVRAAIDACLKWKGPLDERAVKMMEKVQEKRRDTARATVHPR